jgi:hypothetical protein
MDEDNFDFNDAAPAGFRDVELLNLLPGLAEAADAARDPHVKAHLLEAMRVVVDTARALSPGRPLTGRA